VHSTGELIPLFEPSATFRSALSAYEASYPRYQGRVHRFNGFRKIEAALIYSTFLYTTSRVLDLATRHDIPFVFGLYPGGLFRLDDARSDRLLAEICSSPQLAGIIVTQRTSYSYIVDRKLFPKEHIHFVFGVPALDTRGFGAVRPRMVRGVDKSTFDICFVAHKWSPSGRDKGYDIFIEVGKRLVATDQGVRLHVVGPYGPADWDLGSLGENITFYGLRTGEFFRDFYSCMDVILSPNVPFLLAPGAFDGFPLTTCVEAARSGVAVCCTDELHENTMFADAREILIVPHDVNEITSVLEYYLDRYDQLLMIAQRGKARFDSIYSHEGQIAPRLQILAQYGRKGLLGTPAVDTASCGVVGRIDQGEIA
jgi:glycosyltransferase involved in cell wall biosynthesis